MLKKWLLAGLLFAPGDAGGNAGDDAGVSDGQGDPAGDDAGDAHVDDGGAAAGVNAGADDADDDDDEDDFSDLPQKEDPQIKKLLKKLQKRNRQVRRMRPVAQQLKDVDVHDVLTKAKSADQIREALAAHPDLAEQVMAALAGTRKPAAGKAEKPKFDRTKLPFSTDDDSGKFFADFYEQFTALQEELKTTRAELTGLKQAGQQQTRQAVLGTWQSQTKAAAASMPEWARSMFNDAVYGAFREAESKGLRLDPQKVIKHYLSKLPIGDKAKAAAAAAAARGKAATNNSNLPRVPHQAGLPAGARKAGESVADVNRRVRGGGYFPR